MFAGTISDHLFQSRRGPVAGVLYGMMLISSVVLTFTYTTPIVGWLVIFIPWPSSASTACFRELPVWTSAAPRMLELPLVSSTVFYLGTGVMSLVYALVLPKMQLNEAGDLIGPATDPANWRAWPMAMIPLAAIGLVLALRLWNAKPKPKSA